MPTIRRLTLTRSCSASLTVHKILGLPPVLVYACKIIWQFVTLVARLCQLPKPDFICVQVACLPLIQVDPQ